MSEPLTLSVAENKLNELNKNIVEIKKKIQLSGNNSKHSSLIYIAPDDDYTSPVNTARPQQNYRVKSYTYTGYLSPTFTVLFVNDKYVLANSKLIFFFTIFSNLKQKQRKSTVFKQLKIENNELSFLFNF